ncbi:MAG: phosphodiesterase [Ferrovibrio sp.]|uniref:phosphodiesterase n=1 Tax=Ferrovibrio sp. TaxID=1917215 RepID=UPI002604FE46|nr:phosphodiesterase [Ferrovibrio sp.]MCW0233896.1 phosphodiesterase [Ferrovibrio sp.]
MTFQFIHVTDTHLVPPGQTLYDLDPQARLRLCLDDIVRRHADAAFVVITGDLTHWGAPEAYAALRDELARLPLPVHLLLGNHDSRPNFLQAFPQAPLDENGFVQRVLDTPAGRCIFLDSNEPDVSWGVLCDRRLAWLDAELKAETDRPVFLFCHHPPFPVGIRKMDTIGLREPEKFAAVVRPHAARIRHFFFGHLHRPICGSWLGIPFSTMRATSHQVALDFVSDGIVPGSHEPPAYAVVRVDPDHVVVHFHDFLDRTNTFNL